MRNKKKIFFFISVNAQKTHSTISSSDKVNKKKKTFIYLSLLQILYQNTKKKEGI